MTAFGAAFSADDLTGLGYESGDIVPIQAGQAQQSADFETTNDTETAGNNPAYDCLLDLGSLPDGKDVFLKTMGQAGGTMEAEGEYRGVIITSGTGWFDKTDWVSVAAGDARIQWEAPWLRIPSEEIEDDARISCKFGIRSSTAGSTVSVSNVTHVLGLEL